MTKDERIKFSVNEVLKCYGYAIGDYMNNCHTCKTNFIGDKRAITCKKCATGMALCSMCEIADNLAAENQKLQSQLISHIKGESVENICRKCGKSFWNIDDENIFCPFCGCEDMPLHPV